MKMKFIVMDASSLAKSLILVFVSILLLGESILCFNIGSNILDPNDVFSSRDEKSSFGYSVGIYSVNDTKRIIVGAPHAVGRMTRDGALYHCWLGSCSKLVLSEISSSGSIGANSSHALFGVSISVSNIDALIVACAPRYQFLYSAEFYPFKDLVSMSGACYVYKSFSDPPDVYTPCKAGHGVPHSSGYSCGAGFSAVASDGEEAFVVGAPSSNIFRGRFIRMEDGRLKQPDFGTEGLNDNDYSGYAVALGNFTGSTYLDVVVGAPRGGLHNGTVHIFRKNTGPTGGWENASQTLLFGEQFGEYFGSVLEVSDFNGDGLDDLAVGAPFYADESSKMANIGRVYIYYQRPHLTNKTVFTSVSSILYGHTTPASIQPGSFFGTAMAALGDVDQDGFNDLAVGAPFGGEYQAGAVYIFLGSVDGVRGTPSQIIHGRRHNMQGFGSAIKGSLDMDGNGYPDMVVGAYRSAHAVIMKTHPVYNMSLLLYSDQQEIELGNSQDSVSLPKSASTSFNVTAVFKYNGKNVPRTASITLTWTLMMDNTSDPVAFLVRPGQTVHHQSFTITENEERQIQQTVYVTRAIVSVMQPVVVNAKYTLFRPPQTINDPVLNATSPDSATVKVEIKECDLRLTVESSLSDILISKGGVVETTVQIENLMREPCYSIELAVTLPLGISYLGLEPQGSNVVSCYADEQQTNEPSCNLGFIFLGKMQMKFHLRTVIDKPELLFNETTVAFLYNLTSANDRNSDNNIADLEFGLTAHTKMEVTGKSLPDQIIITKNSASQNVTQQFSMTNVGPSPVPSAEIWLKYPVRTSSGIPLLGAFGGEDQMPQIVDSQGSCHNEEYHLAPLTFKDLEPCTRDKPDYLCGSFHCTTGLLPAGETFVINITAKITQDILKLSEEDSTVTLISTAEVKGHPLPVLVEENSLADSTQVKLPIIFPGVKRPPERASWWIYALAITLGVIALGAVIIAMWKCGFFNRKAQKQLYSAKRVSNNLSWANASEQFNEEEMETIKKRLNSQKDDQEEMANENHKNESLLGEKEALDEQNKPRDMTRVSHSSC